PGTDIIAGSAAGVADCSWARPGAKHVAGRIVRGSAITARSRIRYMPAEVHAHIDPLLQRLADLRANIDQVFLGKPAAVTQVLVGLLSRGHLLIEDVPGVGKTVLARTLARSLALSFSRVQLTPDLMPSDII